MTPEEMLALEAITRVIESIVNPFADSMIRMRARMIDEGFSPEMAEQFVLVTAGATFARMMHEAQFSQTKGGRRWFGR
jgi:hypothetical protein